METLELMSHNISGEKFIRLMHDCFAGSDLFSLTRFGGHQKPEDSILSALYGCRAGTIASGHWFYTWSGQTMYIDLYHATEEARDALLGFFDNIYMKSPFKLSGELDCEAPGDICFFKNGVCWFGTCSHERACYAKPEDPALAASLMQCGDWRQDIDGNGDGWLSLTTGFLAEYLK